MRQETLRIWDLCDGISSLPAITSINILHYYERLSNLHKVQSTCSSIAIVSALSARRLRNEYLVQDVCRRPILSYSDCSYERGRLPTLFIRC